MDHKKRMENTQVSIMKFFTREWCWGDLEGSQIELVNRNYNQYIKKVYKKLPYTLKIISKSINFHDGIIKKVEVSPSEKIIIFVGIFGDLEVGYFQLKLIYKGVIGLDLNLISSVFNGKKIEIIRDEIEVMENFSNSNFCHKFIFSNKDEFQLQFTDCNIQLENAQQNDYMKEKCSLVVITDS